MSLLDIFEKYGRVIFESGPNQVSNTTLKDIDSKSLDILDWEKKEELITQYILDHSTFSQDEYYYYSFYDNDIMWSGFDNEIVDEIFVDTDWGRNHENKLRVRFIFPFDENTSLDPVDFDECEEDLKEIIWNFFQKRFSVSESQTNQISQANIEDIHKQSTKKAMNAIIFKDPEVERIIKEFMESEYFEDDDLQEEYNETGVFTKEMALNYYPIDDGYRPFPGDDYDITFQQNGNITSFDELDYFKNITEISRGAFAGCTNLKSITIPIDNIRSFYSGNDGIDVEAFRYCTSLETIKFSGSTQYNWEIGVGAFAQCTNLKEIQIPEGVSKIKDCAFCDCFDLETVRFPKSLKSIGKHAFAGCDRLKNVIGLNIPIEQLIKDDVFMGCPSLPNLDTYSKLKSQQIMKGEDYDANFDFKSKRDEFIQEHEENNLEWLLSTFTDFDLKQHIAEYRNKHDLYGTDLFGNNFDNWEAPSELIRKFQEEYWTQWKDEHINDQEVEERIFRIISDNLSDQAYNDWENFFRTLGQTWDERGWWYLADEAEYYSLNELQSYCQSNKDNWFDFDVSLEDGVLYINGSTVLLHGTKMDDPDEDRAPEESQDPDCYIYWIPIESIW